MKKFKPAIQIHELNKLVELDYVRNFDTDRNYKGDYDFRFNLTNQKIGGEFVNTHFDKYRIRIEYLKSYPPKIFVEKPVLTKRKHQYKDGSLCLYHFSEFKWSDEKSIAFDLVPWIYMWIYFYEMWLKDGKWYGEEYKHK